MALSQEFEERRKVRLRQQRIQKERMRKLRKIFFALLGILAIVIIILCITKCSRNSKDTAGQLVTETEAPMQTVEPIATQAVSYGGIPAPSKGDNDLLDVVVSSGQTHHVYLTFDGGPDPDVTPKILDILRRYNVKGTFFVNGTAVEQYSYLATRMLDEGHLLEPLTYSANSDKLYADKSSFIDEVTKTYDAITKASLKAEDRFKLYRFPDGSTSNTLTGASKDKFKDALADNGYYYCDWNTTIGDEKGTRSAEQILKYYETYRPNLNNLIIKMNNTEDNTSTAEALETIIKGLLDEGYIFSRLDEIDFSNASNTTITTEEPTESASEQPTESTASALSETSATSAPASAAASQSNSSSQTKSGTTSSGTTMGGNQTTTNSGNSTSALTQQSSNSNANQNGSQTNTASNSDVIDSE